MADPAVRDFQPKSLPHAPTMTQAPDGTGSHDDRSHHDRSNSRGSSRLRPQPSSSSLRETAPFPSLETHNLSRHVTGLNSAVSPSTVHRKPSVASTSTESFKRRPQRSNTVRTYHAPSRPNWEPGAEPGIDTTKDFDDDGEHKPLAPCDIAAIDFSEDRIEEHSLDNASLKDFMDQPRAEWASCRWICVDGLSWDVIRLVGNRKKLHRLAIEDLMNTRSRPKADW